MDGNWGEDHERLLRSALHRYRGLVSALCEHGMDFEDIAQDVRVGVWRALCRRCGEQFALSTRIYQVCRSQLLTLLARERRRAARVQWVSLEDYRDVVSAYDVSAEVVKRTEREYLLAELERFVARRFPEEQDQVLAYFRGDNDHVDIEPSRWASVLRACRRHLYRVCAQGF